MATTLSPQLGKFTRLQFVTPDGRLTPEAARELVTVQSILAEGGSAATTAIAVAFTPSGGVSSVTVQGAIQELDAEKADAAAMATSLAGKQPLDTTLSALAGLLTGADKLTYWTGSDIAALTDFTSFARTLLDDVDAAAMRTTLSLGNVTNDAQTKASIVPNTAPSSGQVLLGNGTAYVPSSVSAALDSVGSTQGQILYRNSTGWAVLAPGTAGQVLQTGGAGANPSWVTGGGGGGSGTVTTVSVVSANGFTGSVATPTTTPAITLTTSIAGILKGNGTAMSAAVAGTDYVAPSSFGTGVATFLATPSSANLAAALTDETGSGKVVFDTSPTINSATMAGTTLYTGHFGYGNTSGGTVTQASSKSTGVTLNKHTGEITLSSASLGANTAVSFTLTNSTIGSTDTIIVNHVSGGTLGAYSLNGSCGFGTATITVRNLTTGSLSEAIVLRFALVRGSTT